MQVAIVVFCWLSSMFAMGWLSGKLLGPKGLLISLPIAFFVGYQIPEILGKLGG